MLPLYPVMVLRGGLATVLIHVQTAVNVDSSAVNGRGMGGCQKQGPLDKRQQHDFVF
jgi:hypothetical protein